MKKSLLTRLGAGALILTLVSTVLLSGTLAKYTSTVVATSNEVAAAQWEFKVNGNAQDFTLALKPATDTSVASDKMAPGMYSVFKLELKNTSDVDAIATSSFVPTVTGMSGMKYYKSSTEIASPDFTSGNLSAGLSEITEANSKYTIDTDKALTKTDGSESYFVYCYWPDEGATSSIVGAKLKVIATVTGTQADFTAVTKPTTLD